MPGFDGTGPRGMGPMTGWGRGFCAVPLGGAGSRPYWGRGFYGRGGGRGFRRYWTGPGFPVGSVSKEGELAMLKDQAELLKQQLEDVEARLRKMESPQEPGQK